MNAKIDWTVGQNIKRCREAGGMTQETVAAKMRELGCEMTRSALAKIEVGQRHLYADELIRLREILNTEYDVILSVRDGD